VAKEYKRKYPTTGFWIFVCNRSYWDAEKWLKLGETELFYKVSEHHKDDIQPGQRGVIRLNRDTSSARESGKPRRIGEGVYAIVEVIGKAEYRPDPDARYFIKPEEAEELAWRAPLKVVANLLDRPILAASLPDDESFAHIRKPLFASTIPLMESAFSHILTRTTPLTSVVTEESELANTPAGIRLLEAQYSSATPDAKRRMSLRIERGRIGDAVKRHRKGICQICEAVGANPIAFVDRNGRPYSEAHHVIPVSHRKPGSLSHLNIMVLCPNHHRQAHYGAFEVVADDGDTWSLVVDERSLRIEKTKL
jgi:5-methylcytosine-specific restriction endonuclease McrA